MRTVLVVGVVAAQLAMAQSKAPSRVKPKPPQARAVPPKPPPATALELELGPGRCRLVGPFPSRTLRARVGDLSLATIEKAPEATVAFDARPDPALVAAHLELHGWHLDGFLTPRESIAPAAPMWFGKSVVVNARTPLRLLGGASAVTVEPQAPWWLQGRFTFSASLRRTVECDALALARVQSLEDPVDGEPFAKQVGLSWGPPAGLAVSPDAGAGLPLIDDEGHEVLSVSAGGVIPVRVVARDERRVKVLIIDPTFAVVGWVDAAAVVAGGARKPIEVGHLAPPKHSVCHTPAPMTVYSTNTERGLALGTIDANAPFTPEPTPVFSPWGSPPPDDLDQRLYVSGASFMMWPSGTAWVARPAEMTCAME